MRNSDYTKIARIVGPRAMPGVGLRLFEVVKHQGQIVVNPRNGKMANKWWLFNVKGRATYTEISAELAAELKRTRGAIIEEAIAEPATEPVVEQAEPAEEAHCCDVCGEELTDKRRKRCKGCGKQ